MSNKKNHTCACVTRNRKQTKANDKAETTLRKKLKADATAAFNHPATIQPRNP